LIRKKKKKRVARSHLWKARRRLRSPVDDAQKIRAAGVVIWWEL
jgi:hypothetical protein